VNMIVLVNHLTRMHAGHVCVAGIDLRTVRHVRPIPVRDALSADCLARHGGPFDMARSVELGTSKAAPETPHVEDHLFDPARARLLQDVPPENFWRLLQRLSRARLAELFGPELRHQGGARYGVALGRGRASLGCLRSSTPPQIYLACRRGKPQIRMRFGDGQLAADAGVTDLRLFGPDHATPDAARVKALATRIERSDGVILSLGLTRKFRRSPQDPYVHWLQVNNVHLKEHPDWKLG